jgi:hypothetical protein
VTALPVASRGAEESSKRRISREELVAVGVELRHQRRGTVLRGQIRGNRKAPGGERRPERSGTSCI